MLFGTKQMLNYSFEFFSIFIIILLGFIVYFLIKRTFKVMLTNKYLSYQSYNIIKNILRWLLIVIVVLLVLERIGIQVTSIWATLLTLFGMIAIGFIAVWSIISNVLCFFILITFKPFQIGDEIELIDSPDKIGFKGKVLRFNIFYTIVLEQTNNKSESMLQIPNNIFFQKTIRSYSKVK